MMATTATWALALGVALTKDVVPTQAQETSASASENALPLINGHNLSDKWDC